MAKKAKAIENKITESKSEEENDADCCNDNTEAVGPATPRAVMPTMMQPPARPQAALIPFSTPPRTESLAEKAKAMSQPRPLVTPQATERQDATDDKNIVGTRKFESSKSAKRAVEETSFGEATKEEASPMDGAHVEDIQA